MRMLWLVALSLLGRVFGMSALALETDTSTHTVRFVQVEPGVKLEVLDWGGAGRPLVFLAGLGGTAHSFDAFAPRFVGKFHVYGITRRGYGLSSKPEPVVEAYAADRLGDDVVSVLDQMKLARPVLVGHSFAGEELSSVGSRFPQRVAGLIYLDAGFRYAFSPAGRGDFQIDTLELRRRLDAVLNAISPAETREAIDAALAALPQYETDLRQQKKDWAGAPAMAAGDYAEAVKERSTAEGRIERAALLGERRYTEIRCPVLAIYALPQDRGLPPGAERDAADAWNLRNTGPLADDFAARIPGARVVRIPHARHGVYDSNPAEVEREMNAFLAGLT